MYRGKSLRWPAALGIGLAAGLILGGVWPHTPLHAVSTDRVDTYAMATGPVDAEVEAVYLLDFLTGDLAAIVVGKQAGSWTGVFHRNVANDLQVDPQKNPKYLMVTGMAAIRRFGGNRFQPSAAMCYIAEVSSGNLAAYAVPWSASMYAAAQPQTAPLEMVASMPFRQAAAGGPGATGIPTPKGRAGRRDE